MNKSISELEPIDQVNHDDILFISKKTDNGYVSRKINTAVLIEPALTAMNLFKDEQQQNNLTLQNGLAAITAGHKGYKTYAEAQAAQASLPANTVIEVTNDTTTANNGVYLWDGTTLVKSANDVLGQAKAYADANTVFKPLVNPTEKNLNNLGYGVVYYSTTSDIKTTNNFPVASKMSYVVTYAVSGSSVKYQRVILPFENPIRIFDRSYTSSWSAWIEGTNKNALDALITTVSNNYATEQAFEKRVFSKTGKNLLDKLKIVAGEYVSPATSKIALNANYRRSGFIPVQEGVTYTVSGTSANTIGWYATNDKTATAISVTQTATATAPTGAKFAVINIAHDGTTNFDNTAQFEIGSVKTAYEPYKEYIALSDVENASDILIDSDILYNDSFNKIDPSKVNFTKRYSTGNKGFVTDANLIAASDYIPVTEGEWYTVSGDAIFGLPTAANCQGGYFTSYGAPTAVANITFVTPVSGTGACFKVPTGMGITHVVISLDKNSDSTLAGTAQLEKGEMPTPYQEYKSQTLIKPELLPNQTATTSSNGTFDDKAWYEYTQADGAKIYQDKLPKFRKAMLLKNEDVTVVNSGTSLTARTSEHATLHKDAAFRPPMMHSNAFCSHVWDALKWEGQQYRRYDSAYFTETGTFATSSNLAEWDDGAYRDGLTRYSSDAAASVQFTIPANAWAFNFIYRTDSVGCDAKIAVSEGTGKVQVFDDATQTWIEAHNYEFSQLEASPVTRSVVIPSTITSSTQTVTCASKGNTTYQKRLKMRCRGDNSSFDSLATSKSITITRSGGGARFMYWGVEWSPRQYMITYINAARGSHNTSATGASGLPRFQDNEIWSFKPTLILSELGIHNDGAAAAGVYPVGHWQGLAYNYVNNTDFELSMFSRAAHFNNTTVEYAFFTASIAWNFSGINDDGSLKYSLQTSSEKGPARMMSALDKYQEATEYLNSVGIPCVDAAKRWVEAGVLIFGDMRAATIGSGKNGATFTNEGSHWNDTGAKIVAKAVLPLIK